MKLTRSQKLFIEKNNGRLTVEELSKILNQPEDIIKNHLSHAKWDDRKTEQTMSISKNDSPFVGTGVFSFRDFFRNNWLILIFLSILVFLLYLPFLNNGFVSDDIPGIAQNRHIADIGLFLQRPLSSFRPFLYFLSFKIGGLNPWVFRITNIFAHLFSVLTLYILLSFLSKKNIAFIAATIFAVHPILTESVTWISGGSYSLYTFFFFTSFIFYILSLKEKSSKKYFYYAVSIAGTIFSLLSSVTAVVIPGIFLVYHLTYGEQISKKNIKSILLMFLPFLVLAVGMTYVHYTNVNPRLTTFKTEYYQEQSTYDPLYQIPVALTSYINIILVPLGLTLYHTEPIFINEYIVRLLLFVGMLIYMSVAFFKQKKIFFWLSFYIISLAPTLTPYRISWIVAERYVYLGSAGIIFLIAYLINKIIENKKLETIGYLLFIGVIITYSTLTIFRNIDWLDEEHIWVATGKTSPSSWVNHNNLGDIYSRKGEYDKSIAEFKQSISINPRYADAYNNLANVYIKIGKVQEAINTYEEALKLNPRLWQSYQNIAVISYQMHDYKKAKEFTQKAIQVSPDNPPLYANLGIIELNLQDKISAKEAFTKALQLDPTNQAALAGMKEL